MIRQFLAIKIGNSNIGVALFEGHRIVHSWRVETRPEKTADEYGSQLLDLFSSVGLNAVRIEDAGIVSVVPVLTGIFVDLVQRYLGCEPFVVAPGITTGLEIQYEDPRALGADRLVALVGAQARYGAPLLVIDLGTATTFNALDARGSFVGGAIAPGLNMESQALHQFTAKLPIVEVSPPPRALAANTRDALRSGIFFGYAGLVEGLIQRIRADMGAPPPRVIATGGLASLVAPYCPSVEIVDAQLGFEGLRILYEMNRKNDRRS